MDDPFDSEKQTLVIAVQDGCTGQQPLGKLTEVALQVERHNRGGSREWRTAGGGRSIDKPLLVDIVRCQPSGKRLFDLRTRVVSDFARHQFRNDQVKSVFSGGQQVEKTAGTFQFLDFDAALLDILGRSCDAKQVEEVAAIDDQDRSGVRPNPFGNLGDGGHAITSVSW